MFTSPRLDRAVLDRLLPTGCAGCGRPGPLACLSCRRALLGPASPAWPQPAPAGLPPAWAVAAYGGACRTFLLAYKERGMGGLRRDLARALATSVRSALESVPSERGPLVLVPAPSARGAVRERGDDVVLGLARAAAAELRGAGTQVRVVPALRQHRPVADSAGLDAGSRARNLAGALTVKWSTVPLVGGATVVLVDDLITTGATLAEAARALRAVGSEVVGAATVAATARRLAPGELGGSAVSATVGITAQHG